MADNNRISIKKTSRVLAITCVAYIIRKTKCSSISKTTRLREKTKRTF